MKKLITILCLLLTCNIAIPAQKINLDSIYRELDNAIAMMPQYVAAKQTIIDGLKKELARATSDDSRYDLSRRLYEEYMPFVNDSAIYYIQDCIDFAEKLGRKSVAGECKALLALQCSNTGMYDEALSILSTVRTEDLTEQALVRYYEAQHHVYTELAYYSRVDKLRQEYQDKEEKYKTLLLDTAPESSDIWFLESEKELLNSGSLAESMDLNDRWLKSVEKGSHRYALAALYRYLEFKAKNDSTEMMYWVTESALADVRNAVMNQGSMWEIANQMMVQGDIARSYRYVSFASDCANKFGSRVRNWQLSPLLTAIDRGYQQESARTTSQLRLLLAAISVLAVLMVLLMLYLLRQRKRLSIAHGKLHESNEQLGKANEQLSALNSQLSASNEQLSALNATLSESNRVKEEYVGRFMRMCSIYIDKLDKMRKMVNKKVKNHEYQELYNMTRSQEQKDKELDELYENFDTAFLHLFPDFVSDFNALLKPEERIELTDPKRLSTGIRIFALIRLGIDDSSKIAEFLHYSVNTIYNYRARIKNGAITDRDNFERNVKEIGMPKA